MWTSLNFGKFLPAQARQNVFFTPFTHTPVPGHYSAALCHYVLDLSFLEFHLDDTVWYTLLLWPAASAQHAFEVYPFHLCISSSFIFFLCNIPSCGYATICWMTHLSNKHLGCFQGLGLFFFFLLAIVNRVVMNSTDICFYFFWVDT